MMTEQQVALGTVYHMIGITIDKPHLPIDQQIMHPLSFS
jgi:hypothetical protein